MPTHRAVCLILWLGNAYRRFLATALAIAGPEIAYAVTGMLARCLYRLLTPLRVQSEAQCRAALRGRIPAQRIPFIAKQGFIHRIWNLTDLMLADRLLGPRTWHRYGGRIPERDHEALQNARRRRRPVILVTAYYGPFDLLPIFLGYNGVRAGVVYRTHENAAFDDYRRRIRGRSGCELIPLERALGRATEILEGGGVLAIVADHHAERGGLPVTFLGLPTMAMRSVALLAWRYDAAVAVAGIRRAGRAFRFEIVVADVIAPENWTAEADPMAYITNRYLRGLEGIILADPTQYLWAHPRWGREFARELLHDRPAP